MNNKIAIATLLALTATPVVVPTAAVAEGQRHYHSRTYHDRSGQYRHRCGGGSGAVGTIAGGVGGALVGNAVGGGTLGTIAGGVGGGLLGRHIDKARTRHSRGC